MTMQLLTCHHCGASLEVPEGTRFLTCQACSSRLEVQHTETAAATQVLDQPAAAKTPFIDEISRQDELLRLDRLWEREREEYLIRGKFGQTRIPRTGTGLLTMTFGVIFGGLLIGMNVAMGTPVIFSWLGGLFIMSVVIGSVGTLRKARLYRAREAEYARRREELGRK
jgi:DNA-directed RNA polymerase subunit RPC12/RpoP